MGTRQARPMRSRRSSWTGSAALRTRSRKDGPLDVGVEDGFTPREWSEWEETPPAAPDVLLRLQEDMETTLNTNKKVLYFVIHFFSICKMFFVIKFKHKIINLRNLEH